jgi:hypothetical protein
MRSKHGWAGVALAVCLMAFGSAAWAAPGDNKPAGGDGGKAHLTGTALDAGVKSLKLDAATLAKIGEALKPWKEKNKAAKEAATSQADALKAKIDELKKKLEALDEPVKPAEQYKGARDLLKGILTDEKLTQVDAAAREATLATATKMFDTEAGKWSKKVELTPDQKDKVAAVQGKLKDELAKLDVGASPRGVVTKLIKEAEAALPQDVQDKINGKGGKQATSKPSGDAGKGIGL